MYKQSRWSKSCYFDCKRTGKWPLIETPLTSPYGTQLKQRKKKNKIIELHKFFIDQNTNIAIITKIWLAPTDIFN